MAAALAVMSTAALAGRLRYVGQGECLDSNGQRYARVDVHNQLDQGDNPEGRSVLRDGTKIGEKWGGRPQGWNSYGSYIKGNLDMPDDRFPSYTQCRDAALACPDAIGFEWGCCGWYCALLGDNGVPPTCGGKLKTANKCEYQKSAHGCHALDFDWKGKAKTWKVRSNAVGHSGVGSPSKLSGYYFSNCIALGAAAPPATKSPTTKAPTTAITEAPPTQLVSYWGVSCGGQSQAAMYGGGNGKYENCICNKAGYVRAVGVAEAMNGKVAFPAGGVPAGKCLTFACFDETDKSKCSQPRGFAGDDYRGGLVCKKSCTLPASGVPGNSFKQFHLHRCEGMLLCMEKVVEKAVPPAAVRGDPFAVNQHGQKEQFFLRADEEALLLGCGELKLYGHVMGTGVAGDHQQWFDRVRFVAGGQEQLLVNINRNATNGVAELKTLDVQIEGQTVSKSGSTTTDRAMIAIYTKGTVEVAQFSMGNTVVEVKSAVAQKFVGAAEQKQYTHLDLQFAQLKHSECTVGILPEIWGLVPMSEQTSERLQPPQ